MMWLVIVGGERVMSVLCRPMCVPCCLNVRKSSMYDNPRIDTVIGAVTTGVRLSHVGFKCGTHRRLILRWAASRSRPHLPQPVPRLDQGVLAPRPPHGRPQALRRLLRCRHQPPFMLVLPGHPSVHCRPIDAQATFLSCRSSPE